jgi:hypothetical protein
MNLFSRFFGGQTSDFRVSACSESAGDGGANVEDLCAFGFGASEGLGVGVDGPEFYASYAGVEHAIYLFLVGVNGGEDYSVSVDLMSVP